jgi:nucleoside-diphosphate-sugar epimerase
MILPDKWYRLSPNDELLISSMEKELVNHPNTYTLSKSVAEQAVLEYSEKLPICVVRPSIIVGAEMEPFEGWVEGINEVTSNNIINIISILF